jgi:hypothetical protein
MNSIYCGNDHCHRYEKARRGELIVAAPVGFVKVGDRLERDPDRRVQKAIELVFDKPRNWAARARRCCGSTNTTSSCLRSRATVKSNGADPAASIG